MIACNIRYVRSDGYIGFTAAPFMIARAAAMVAAFNPAAVALAAILTANYEIGVGVVIDAICTAVRWEQAHGGEDARQNHQER